MLYARCAITETFREIAGMPCHVNLALSSSMLLYTKLLYPCNILLGSWGTVDSPERYLSR